MLHNRQIQNIDHCNYEPTELLQATEVQNFVNFSAVIRILLANESGRLNCDKGLQNNQQCNFL